MRSAAPSPPCSALCSATRSASTSLKRSARTSSNFFGYAGKIDELQASYAAAGVWIILLKGVTPIPFKLVTIVSGAMAFDPIDLHRLMPRHARRALPARRLAVPEVRPDPRPIIEKRVGMFMLLFVVDPRRRLCRGRPDSLVSNRNSIEIYAIREPDICDPRETTVSRREGWSLAPRIQFRVIAMRTLRRIQAVSLRVAPLVPVRLPRQLPPAPVAVLPRARGGELVASALAILNGGSLHGLARLIALQHGRGKSSGEGCAAN